MYISKTVEISLDNGLVLTNIKRINKLKEEKNKYKIIKYNFIPKI